MHLNNCFGHCGRAATGGIESRVRFPGARARTRGHHAPAVGSWVILNAGLERVSGRLYGGEWAQATMVGAVVLMKTKKQNG